MAQPEIVAGLIETVTEIISDAGNTLLRKDENFKRFGGYLQRILPVLQHIRKSNSAASPAVGTVLDTLHTLLHSASLLAHECSSKNRLYLLLNSRAISTRLTNITSDMGRALSLLPLASLQLSRSLLSDANKLVNTMKRVHFLSPDGDLLRTIDSVFLRKVDADHANLLLLRIADAVGISQSTSSLREELRDLKRETENLRVAKRHAEAKEMEQIIALLERSDIMRTRGEKEREYVSGEYIQPFEAMISFYCPITREVMVDPVDTSSGQTYERSAIQKWIAEGNTCPLTKLPLDAASFRPNKSLRDAIHQWNDRNAKASISSIKLQLHDKVDESVIPQLVQLEKFCDSDRYREYVLLENYVPVLVRCLGSRSSEVRNLSLTILCVLVKSNEDAAERIVECKDAIGYIARSLGRKIEEGRIAVELLLQICRRNSEGRDILGRSQGCFLLLACMSASEEARELLKVLAFSDSNIVQMARVNYFTHLVDRLRTGNNATKLLMTTTLAEIELTDGYKETLFSELIAGVLPPLLELISSGDSQMKAASLKALRNLSTVPAVSIEMIRAGAVAPLFNVLYRHTSAPSAREHVAFTVMNLALASSSLTENEVSFLESEEDVIKLLNLIPLIGSDVQPFVLRAFTALCESPSAEAIKKTLNESPAMQMLFPLLGQGSEAVRMNAMKLLSCLMKGSNKEMLTQEAKACIESVIRIVKDSPNEEEVAGALAILSDFPENPEIQNSLVIAGAIPIILKIIARNGENSVETTENSTAVLHRFTSPDNVTWQSLIAKSGTIPLLVKLLEVGTSQTKINVSKCLERLSKSSTGLSREKTHRTKLTLFLRRRRICAVHGGSCSVTNTFCLVEARAVEPLIRNLGDSMEKVKSASMDALLTLIEKERLQAGMKYLANPIFIRSLIRFLSSSDTQLVEKSLDALERIFRIAEVKALYGREAVTILVELTMRGSSSARRVAGKILACLHVLDEISSFF